MIHGPMTLIASALIVMLFALAAQIDEANQLDALSSYCKGVRNNVHPDYDSRFVQDCGGDLPPVFEPNKFAK